MIKMIPKNFALELNFSEYENRNFESMQKANILKIFSCPILDLVNLHFANFVNYKIRKCTFNGELELTDEVHREEKKFIKFLDS